MYQIQATVTHRRNSLADYVVKQLPTFYISEDVGSLRLALTQALNVVDSGENACCVSMTAYCTETGEFDSYVRDDM